MINKNLNKEDYKLILKARTYANELHDNRVNQMYDKKLGLPYSYHLGMAVDFGLMFVHLLPTELRGIAIAGIYLHDSVEDARQTFNKINKAVGCKRVAQIACNLCCDVWGINRDERHSPSYYKRINRDILSVYGKLCDRMANVYHGLLNDSEQVRTYELEMECFLKKLEYKNDLLEMFMYLKEMINNNRNTQ